MIFVLVLAWSAVLGRIAARRRILLVGTSGAGQDVVRELQATPRAPFQLIGIVGDGGQLDDDLEAPVIGEIDNLADLIRLEQPSIIVVAVDRNRPAIFEPLLDSADAGFRVVEAAQFMEHAFGHVPVRDIQRAWFMSVLHLYQRPYSRLAKRIFDVVVAAIGLLATLPFLPLLALVVRLSPGPLLFRQVRMGEFGRTFTMLKFRTMRSNAEESGHAIWAQTRDPRVTRAGRVMRRLRLDEIPQLWNVMRGDMSIVGPRPERPEFMQFLEQRVPFWTHRQLVKPGITGWAQVRRGYTSDAEGSVDKLSYDLWYIRHRSIVVDIAICLRTLWVLAMGTPSEMSARAQPDRSDATEALPPWVGNPPHSAPTTNAP
jgi:exopolysaccharide biosynthesis polyprenyl glycosylphosphotransferase